MIYFSILNLNENYKSFDKYNLSQSMITNEKIKPLDLKWIASDAKIAASLDLDARCVVNVVV